MDPREHRCLLLVESEEAGYLLLRGLLEEIRDIVYEVVRAPSFERGLELLGNGGFDACLVDDQLDPRSGLAFVEAVRETGDATPLILLTGTASRELDLAAMAAGASDFLEKQAMTAALLDRSIRYAIQKGKAAAFHLDLLEERAARAEAETAIRTRDEFLARLSHELRTPLAAVLGLASGLEHQGDLPAAARSRLAAITRNARLEARLIDDLLDVTRMTQGTLILEREPVDVAALLDQAIETCCLEVRASGRLRIVKEPGAVDHRLWGDPTRLLQAFWNLLSNAVKFTPDGGTITVRTRRDERGWLEVEVADDGIGIEPHELPRLFESFEQGSAARRTRAGGLGLGLAITRTLVDLHGGELSVRSEGPAKGASFFVHLPPGEPVDPAIAEPASPGAPEGEAPAAPHALHILLVEDHSDTAAAFASLLRLLGHRVTQAGGLAEGLALAKSIFAEPGGALDLVMSDLALGDGSGFELMKELSELYGVPGIAVSGFGMENVVRQSEESGFDLHLIKPIDLGALSKAIHHVLERRRPAEAREG